MTELTAQAWRRTRWAVCGLGPARWARTAAEAIGRFGAVQAQEFEFTLWSLAQRTGQTREEILAEFSAGDFVRTHAIRQTWHFVHSADLARVQAATADRVQQVSAYLYRNVGLDTKTQNWLRDWLPETLAEGPMTRPELRTASAEAGRPLEGLLLLSALMWAELEMIIANGPMRGKAHTYRLLADETLPDKHESIAWLVGTFLASHGPSTIADIAAWSTLKRSDISRALEVAGADSGPGPAGTCFWTDIPAAVPQPGAMLLNGYDEYISGLSPESKRQLDPLQLHPGRPGIPIHVVLADGELAGYWRRKAGRASITLEVVPARPFSGDERGQLQRQAEQYAQYAGVPVELHESVRS